MKNETLGQRRNTHKHIQTHRNIHTHTHTHTHTHSTHISSPHSTSLLSINFMAKRQTNIAIKQASDLPPSGDTLVLTLNANERQVIKFFFFLPWGERITWQGRPGGQRSNTAPPSHFRPRGRREKGWREGRKKIYNENGTKEAREEKKQSLQCVVVGERSVTGRPIGRGVPGLVINAGNDGRRGELWMKGIEGKNEDS